MVWECCLFAFSAFVEKSSSSRKNDGQVASSSKPTCMAPDVLSDSPHLSVSIFQSHLSRVGARNIKVSSPDGPSMRAKKQKKKGI
jgi:hypothetical protein